MQENNRRNEPTSDLTGLPEDIRREIATYRAVRSFLSRCLLLNHDINNPLAGIIGYAEVLLEDSDPLTEEQRTGLEHILRCAEKIRTISDGLSEDKARLIEQGLLNLLQQPPAKN
jgi:signal transduction histidine kinase